MCLNNSHPVAGHGSRVAGREHPVASLGSRVAGQEYPVARRSSWPAFDSGLATRDSGRRQRDSRTATRDPRLRQRHPRRRERGFSIITAIFLVVVLAMLGVFIVSVTGLQQAGTQLDVQGVRAYQAARAGVEWAAFQILTPSASTPPVCPASPTNIAGLGGSLSPFTVTVTCTATAVITEGSRNVRTYQIVSIACNEPAGGSCLVAGNPIPNPTPRYVERQVQVVLSRCNDPDPALAPKFACG